MKQGNEASPSACDRHPAGELNAGAEFAISRDSPGNWLPRPRPPCSPVSRCWLKTPGRPAGCGWKSTSCRQKRLPRLGGAFSSFYAPIRRDLSMELAVLVAAGAWIELLRLRGSFCAHQRATVVGHRSFSALAPRLNGPLFFRTLFLSMALPSRHTAPPSAALMRGVCRNSSGSPGSASRPATLEGSAPCRCRIKSLLATV